MNGGEISMTTIGNESLDKWEKFSDKLPPLEKGIIVLERKYDFSYGKEVPRYLIHIGAMSRPYDIERKYNPDYYQLFIGDGYREDYMEMYWMRPSNPFEDSDLKARGNNE